MSRPIVNRFAQPAAAAVSMVVLLWVVSHGFLPTWPMWTMAGLLAFGFLARPLGRFADAPAPWRSSHTVAAFAVLLLLIIWLPHRRTGWEVSPICVTTLLLGLALIARPLTRIEDAPSLSAAGQLITMLAALLLLIRRLATESYWYLTATPGKIHMDGSLPIGTLRVVMVLLCAGLLAGRLAVDRPALRAGQIVAGLAALALLLLALAFPPARGIRPESLLWAMVALLAVGLVDPVGRLARDPKQLVALAGLLAEPFARLVRDPRERALSARVDELSRTRSGALDVQATELRRIERDLHDGAQVRLVALSMKLGRAEDRYRDDPETAALLREAREDAAAAIRDLRELARGIAPPVLADRGLEAAARSLAQRSGADVSVTSTLERRPLPAVETAAYFVVAESLTNAAKHAPGARVEIRLDERGGDLFVEVTDFGPGGADPAGGGLTGLRQRVEALDGALHVTSPGGVGTQVEAVISCGQ